MACIDCHVCPMPNHHLLRLVSFLVLFSGNPIAAIAKEPNAHDDFWASLQSHCGKAYRGQMVSDEAADADMRGVTMMIHVRECSETQIKIPFHVQRTDGSWDRSRTWIFTRLHSQESSVLRLKHDHRHEDGKPDAMTLYGGVTIAPGSAAMQEFQVDAESIALFKSEGRTASVTNTWRVEVAPANQAGGRFSYKLLRKAPHPRNFHVEFDLTQPISIPPAPWGSD